MRRMKFRVYDKRRQEWVHDTKHALSLFGEFMVMGYLLTRPDGTEVRLSELNDLEAMEHIGINDRNGAEIFEGDVVDVKRKGCDEVSRLTIKDLRFIPVELFGPEVEWVEVVGNVFDNPDLNR